MDIKHILQSLHESLKAGDGMMIILPIFGMIWLFWMVKGYLIPSLKTTKNSIKTSEEVLKRIEKCIEEAVKRAPPVEAKPSEEGAPFEEYRKDLWRMAEGEISIDEFVDLWRGRKVQKRPKPEKKLTPEEIEQVKDSDVFKTITTVISEFSKRLEKLVELKQTEALCPEKTWEEQAYQFDEIQKDLGAEPGSTFLVLWAQYLKSSDPGKLADFFAAWVKGEANSDFQIFAKKFLIFMKNREWDQVLTVIEPRLQSKELFQSAYAEIFFIGFRDGVLRRCQGGIPGGTGPRGPDGQDGLGTLQGPPGVSGVEFLEPLRFDTPFCQDFFKEWALHLRSNQKPHILANMFLGWMGDSALPVAQAGASKFAGFMKARSWKEVFEAIKPWIEPAVYVTFCAEGAADFYEAFRAIVVEEIRNYWDEFIESKKVKKVPQTFVGVPAGKQPKYRLGDFVRVKRQTSPGYDQIGRIQSIHDNGIEWDYIMELRNAHGNGFVLGLPQSELELAQPRVGEWWKWVKNDGCTSVYRPGTYEPFQWKGTDEDVSVFNCCHEGCLVPVNFGRGE